MIDTQAIRSKILDLAMRGKLTEQLPEDGTAEELYRQIQSEKQSLIKAGKIKKEKPLPEISEEERPFPIPTCWRWTYLGELFQHNTGKALNSSDTHGKQLEYITTSNLYWNRFELDGLKTMPFSDSELEKCTVRRGDLLVCEGGDIGRAAIWTYDYEMRIQNHIHRLRRYSENIYPAFYYYLLWLYKQTGRINGIGIGLQGFSSKRVHSLIVPLAPYHEAVRLVEVIKKAFSALDTIDALQAKYADNLAVLKSKLIDAAIQGKLTEQLPEDGTAEDLYRQIQAEKQALIKSGKIKKEKPLPEIDAECKECFDIPESWRWTSVGSVCINIQYGSSKKSSSSGKMAVLRMGNIQAGKIVYDDLVYTSDDDEIVKHPLEKDDLLFNRTNSMELVGKAAIYKGEMPAIYAGYLVRLTPLGIVSEYLNYVMQSKYYWDYCRTVRIDSNGQSNINAEKLKRFVFPLPPLAEQKRIVAKLEALLPLCERLK